MARPYPLVVTSERSLPVDYDGPVFVSDIDKTYLATRFSSFEGLARIPLEFAVDKRAIAGMTEVLRGVRRGPGPGFAAAPLYFVSSSPPQLRPVIERKMLLDGVQPDGFTFKDWARTVLAFRPRRLKEHLGFKLAALLRGRAARPRSAEYLFGDDVEKDADAYSLYARALSGEVSGADLYAALADHGVDREDREHVIDMLGDLPPARGRVAGSFINLVRQTEPADIEARAPGTVPVRDAFQLALALFERGLVDAECVLAARADVRDRGGLEPGALESRVEDAFGRQLVGNSALRELGFGSF